MQIIKLIFKLVQKVMIFLILQISFTLIINGHVSVLSMKYEYCKNIERSYNN